MPAQNTPILTAEQPAAVEQPETPGPKWATSTICTTPATVEDCRADYKAGAEIRRRFDATARRQHRGA